MTLLLLLACGSGPAEAPSDPAWGPSPTLKEHMAGHAESVDRMWHALEQGDLSGARSGNEEFLDHKIAMDLPGNWIPHVTAMGEAAMDLRKAETAAAGIHPAVALTVACAGCHAEVGIALEPLPPEPAEGHARARGAMDTVRYALIFHKDAYWVDASKALVEVLAEDEVADDALRELVARAEATKPAARPQMAAEILTACANCHTR